MPDAPYRLGIDLGGTKTEAILFDQQGNSQKGFAHRSFSKH